jgi:hypothetical protein
MFVHKGLSAVLSAAVMFAAGSAPAAGFSTPTLRSSGELEEPRAVGRPIFIEADLSEGSMPTGTITFFLYESSDSTCSGTPVAAATVPVNGDGLYSTGEGGEGEPNLVVHSFGLYRAVLSYSGDQNNAPIFTACGEPSFWVSAVPTLVITSSEPAIAGRPVHLLGRLLGGSEPSGSIEMAVYEPTDPHCEETPLLSSTGPIVAGAAVSAETFVPPAAGWYPISGFYGGDEHNLSVFANLPMIENIPEFAGCEESGSLGLMVAPTTPALDLEVSPPVTVGQPVAATAHLLGGYRAGGTVTFSLFEPGDLTCSGAAAATVSALLSGDLTSSGELTTSAVGRYNFTARYSGDHDNSPVSSGCGAASVTVARAAPTITAAPYSAGGLDIGERASLSGGFDPSGTVKFTLFGPNDPTCAGPPRFRVIAPVINSVADTGAIFTEHPGHFGMRALYDGDANNAPTSGACQQIVVKASPPSTSDGTVRELPRGARTLSLRVVCPARPSSCRGAVELYTLEHLVNGHVTGLSARAVHGFSRRLLVGHERYRIKAGGTATVTVSLTPLAHALAHRFGKLPVRVTLLETTIGAPAETAPLG